MLNQVSTIARQHVDDGYLDHRVATRLQAHGGTGHVDQYLTREGGVVNAHIELQALVLGLAADAFATMLSEPGSQPAAITLTVFVSWFSFIRRSR